MLLKPRFMQAASLITVVMAFGCSEQVIPAESKNVNPTAGSAATARVESSNPFNASVGAPIDNAVGERWIDNYRKDYASQAKTYNIKSDALAKILSTNKCVGVSFAYAVDFQNRLHVLPIGVNSDGKLITSSKVYTQHGDIHWKTAQRWIKNYTGPVQSHFFGQNTFQRLWSSGSADVTVTFALDDKNNPQLLLATAAPASDSGKVAASSTYQDASAACPPACPK